MMSVLIRGSDEDTDTHRGKAVGGHREDGCLQAVERGCRRSQPCQHLDPGLLAARTVRKYISVAPATQGFVMAALADEYTIAQDG